MASNYAPSMSTDDYLYCLGKATKATSAEEVQRLRTAVLRRWSGDPRAAELADALYARQERLAARENALRVEASRIRRRHESRAGRLPA